MTPATANTLTVLACTCSIAAALAGQTWLCGIAASLVVVCQMSADGRKYKRATKLDARSERYESGEY